MRGQYLVISILLLLTSLLGYMSFSVQNTQTVGVKESIAINKLIEEFKIVNNVAFNFDLSQSYINQDYRSLVQPRNYIVGKTTSSKSELQTNAIDFKKCNKLINDKYSSSLFDKYKIWQKYICQISKELPKDFFLTPPFLHPTGNSYVFLAYGMRTKRFSNESWLKENIGKIHVSELKDVDLENLKTDDIFKTLSKFSENEIENILRRSEVFLTKEFIFFKKKNGVEFNLDYLVYRVGDLSEFFSEKSYYFERWVKGKQCYAQIDGICLQRNSGKLIQFLGKSSLAAFFILIGVMAYLLLLFLRRIEKDKVENQQNRFALEVLTHEFRTPITSLILQVDRLNKNYSELNEKTKEISPIISGEVYRLQRLTEETKRYLLLTEKKGLLSFKKETIKSVNDFVESHISFSDKKIEFYGLHIDRSIKADGYWLGMCLKNLIENAKEHGGSFIKVRVQLIEEGGIAIEVEDSGQANVDNLELLAKEFFKDKSGKGLGLGLSLVTRILNEMGGELTSNSNPTRFKMYLKDC